MLSLVVRLHYLASPILSTSYLKLESLLIAPSQFIKRCYQRAEAEGTWLRYKVLSVEALFTDSLISLLCQFFSLILADLYSHKLN